MTEHEINRREEEELDKLAWRYVQGEIFLTNDPKQIRESFSFILMALSDKFDSDEEWKNFVEDIGGAYEEISKASPRSVNGNPFFMSASFIHKNDTDYLLDKIYEYEEKIDEVNPIKNDE